MIGEWVYYVNESDGSRIYKMRTDGTEKTPLNDEESGYMNVAGDWIYFTNESDGGKIYKIRTDGTERTILGGDKCSYINVADGWIFYANQSDGGKLYKIGIDGTGCTKLSDDENCRNIIFADGRVYYGNWVYFEKTNPPIVEGEPPPPRNLTPYWVWSLHSIRADGTEYLLDSAIFMSSQCW
ncbi:hypothetical protein SDC9_184703 [bioreactor metagenome]|uniref:Prolow-density lipoprotein receptor-related protein 1-like beta-propeller domain-containing protein n=1 Tax=bioreactor metagenome TaxID=1076179 RepID=A0A645HDS6_9ZZZZ